ncbi:hypothetical protein BHM03_00021204 [Ensete ventricosum]|nr:hypothetical protein BHM03_00021204 [Ensete ventricosum]
MLTSDDGTPVPPRDASLPVWPTEYCTCQRPSGFLLAVRDGSGAANPEIPSSRQRTIVTCLTRDKRRKFEDANKAGGVGGEERRPMGVQGNKQFCFAAFPLSEPRRFLEPFFSLQFEAIRLPPVLLPPDLLYIPPIPQCLPPSSPKLPFFPLSPLDPDPCFYLVRSKFGLLPGVRKVGTLGGLAASFRSLDESGGEQWGGREEIRLEEEWREAGEGEEMPPEDPVEGHRDPAPVLGLQVGVQGPRHRPRARRR